MRILFLFIFSSMFFFTCTNETNTVEEHKSDKIKTVETKPAPAPKLKYKLTPFTPSKSFPDAKIESISYKKGKFDFGVGGKSYTLGSQTDDAAQKMCANSGKGQHIHLIVDNAPYAAKYTNKFDYDIADGEHYILAFLSRSYHESIKTKDAHVAQRVLIKDKSIVKGTDVNNPILFYSRPKGTYIGKANTQKVMLDFYLSNITLGKDYKVKAAINGEEHILDTWQPYYIEGLPIGENTVTLTLVDGSGKIIPNIPMNPVSREFILKDDPIEDKQ